MRHVTPSCSGEGDAGTSSNAEDDAPFTSMARPPPTPDSRTQPVSTKVTWLEVQRFS